MAEVALSEPALDETENQVQADENYKLYKRRWLVLMAMFSISLVVGLHRCIISIADLINSHVGINDEQYDYLAQVSLFVMLMGVFPVASALEYFGLRRMAYFACGTLLCANFLKILGCSETYFTNPLIKDHRYVSLMLSEAFLGLANSVVMCVPPKVANAWFANYENTLALVIAYCGYNIGVSSSNYFTPIFVKTPQDIEKLCYMFIISGGIVTFIVLTCITRSSPKIPPSSNALISANLSIPIRDGIKLMLKQPLYLLLLLTVTLNLAALNSEQILLDVIIKTKGYSNNFCGTLIAHSYFFGTFFMLMGAAWLDNSPDYLKVSKISCAICMVTMVLFNISICIPNIEVLITIANLLVSFGASLVYPSMLQVAIKSALGILPEATISALVIITQQILSVITLNLFSLMTRIFVLSDYIVPIATISLCVILVNTLYIALFKALKKEHLLEQLCQDQADLIPPEPED